MFGTEAVIPVEIGLTSWRTNHHDEDSNNSQLRLNLNLLDENRDQAEVKTTAYQKRMARYYNRRVKYKEFGRPSIEKSDSCHQRSNPGKTRAHVGKTIQDRQVLQKGHLSPREDGRHCTSTPLEYRTPKEVLPVRHYSKFLFQELFMHVLESFPFKIVMK